MPFFVLTFAVLACDNAANDGNNSNILSNPAETHSPSEAIPDSTRILNDSVIVADTTGD